MRGANERGSRTRCRRVKKIRAYREGLAYLQAGKWQEAIRSFEAVLREYPDSQPVQQALAEARFKATIDAKSHVRARRWIVPWRAIIFRLLIVVLIVLVAVAGFRLVSRQFAPALAQAETLRQQRQLLADGTARLEAGDLDAAEAQLHGTAGAGAGSPGGSAGTRSDQNRRANWMRSTSGRSASRKPGNTTWRSNRAHRPFSEIAGLPATSTSGSPRSRNSQEVDQLFAGRGSRPPGRPRSRMRWRSTSRSTHSTPATRAS